MDKQHDSLPTLPAASLSASEAAVPVIDSSSLFAQGNTVFIAHHGQRYVLRLTRENKLILTK